MRIRSLVCATLLGVMVAPATLLHAQFKDPTKEELQMTSDPKAPGAAAVYLDREVVTNDPLHYRTYYERIKILQDKGKKLATVQIPYVRGQFKIRAVKGRTIHPDGTIIPLDVKPEDLLVAKGGKTQIGKVVFNLPSVTVGSIIEYQYQIDYPDRYYSSPFWYVQQPYYVHHAHFEFSPFPEFRKNNSVASSRSLVDENGDVVNSLLWWYFLPPGDTVKSDVRGRYTLDINDIPPTPDEAWMPPIQSLTYRVFFYYSSAFTGKEFWARSSKRWSKRVDDFAKKTRGLRKVVASLVAPGDSDQVKAQKLYKAVQGLENTDYTRAKGETELKQAGLRAARNAEDVWKQKSGSSQDITRLYLAMLRAAGIPANEVIVVDRDRGFFLTGYLSFDQFDSELVVATIGGKQVPLDPGEKMCPYGLVSWTHAGAGGLEQSKKGTVAVTLPFQPYLKNSLIRMGDLNLDPQGNVKGMVQFIMAGQDALRWRQAALLEDKDDLKKDFDNWIKDMVPVGVTAHLDHMLGLASEDTNLIARINISGSIGTATSTRLLLPGSLFESRSSQPFVQQTKRLEPVDMHFAEKVTDKMVLHLPPGYTVEGAPKNAKLTWPHEAAFAEQTVVAPGQVTQVRQLLRGFTLLKPAQYEGLRGFYQKMNAADQQQLVLHASSTESGN